MAAGQLDSGADRNARRSKIYSARPARIRRGWNGMTLSKPIPMWSVCMPCGYDLKRTRAEMHWHDWSKLRAQIYLADGNQYLNRPGPRVAKSLRILAEILYPESFEPTLEGIGWEKF